MNSLVKHWSRLPTGCGVSFVGVFVNRLDRRLATYGHRLDPAKWFYLACKDSDNWQKHWQHGGRGSSDGWVASSLPSDGPVLIQPTIAKRSLTHWPAYSYQMLGAVIGICEMYWPRILDLPSVKQIGLDSIHHSIFLWFSTQYFQTYVIHTEQRAAQRENSF